MNRIIWRTETVAYLVISQAKRITIDYVLKRYYLYALIFQIKSIINIPNYENLIIGNLVDIVFIESCPFLIMQTKHTLFNATNN